MKWKAHQRLQKEIKSAKSFVPMLLSTEYGQEFLLHEAQKFYGSVLPSKIAARIKNSSESFTKQAFLKVMQTSAKETIAEFQKAFATKGNGMPTLTFDHAKWVLDCVADHLDDFVDLELVDIDVEETILSVEDAYVMDEDDDPDEDADEDYSPKKISVRPAPDSVKRPRGRPPSKGTPNKKQTLPPPPPPPSKKQKNN